MADDDKVQLIGRLLPSLASDEYDLVEVVVRNLVPLLSPEATADLDTRLAKNCNELGPAAGIRDWAGQGQRYRLVRTRQAIADRLGDVDRFIALASERPSGREDNIGIAERLLAAGRAREALDWVRRPSRPGLRSMSMADIADVSDGTDLQDRSRVRLEIRILTAVGEKNAAQGLRWPAFEAGLDHEILREYVACLPDFEEFDVLERAFAHVASHPQRYGSLGFFLAWPRLDLAAKLVVLNRAGWAGQHYHTLVPAAEALEHDHPVAATVLYRALLDDILVRARSPAYGHGARYLARLYDLSRDDLADMGLADHESYRAGLRKVHGRKAAFWNIVEGQE